MAEPARLLLGGPLALLRDGEHDLVAPVSSGDLRPALEELLGRWLARAGQRRPSVAVELGNDHCSMTVVEVEDAHVLSSYAQTEVIAAAWATEFMHRAPDKNVLRIQAFPAARRMLLSCVDRQSARTASEACAQAGVHLASILPAAAILVRSAAAGMGSLVLHERFPGEAAHPVVQAVALQEGVPLQWWRGWVGTNSQAMAVDALLARMEAPNHAHEVAHLSWPEQRIGASDVSE